MNTVKKLALVTCYFQPNFGSQLQAYATQLLFDKMGVPNETICIDGIQNEVNKAKFCYFLSRIWDFNTIKDKWSVIKKSVAAKTKGKAYKQNMTLRKQMFYDFSHTKIHISKYYKSKAEITANAYNYAGFVVGSDQLWLPSNIAGDYYSLNFVPADVLKITLSTSFGVSQLPKAQAKKAAKFLKRLDYISVREVSGQKLVKKLADRDVPIVCDPTILFTEEEWGCITRKERFYMEPYIFCYFLGNNPEQRKFVKKVKEITGFKIVQLQHCDEYIKSDVDFPDYAPYNVGPAEFIQLIRDAEFVFTDSFHATVFSLLQKKKFFTFRRYSNDGIISTNGRLYSLLSLVDQNNRLLRGDENIKKVLNIDINYDNIHVKLDELRCLTKQFIKDVLDQNDIDYDKDYG